MLAVVCPIEGAVPERYGQLIDTVLQNAKKVSGDKKDTEAAVILRDEKDFLYWCETQKKPGSCIVFAVHLDRSGINLRLYVFWAVQGQFWLTGKMNCIQKTWQKKSHFH